MYDWTRNRLKDVVLQKSQDVLQQFAKSLEEEKAVSNHYRNQTKFYREQSQDLEQSLMQLRLQLASNPVDVRATEVQSSNS